MYLLDQFLIYFSMDFIIFIEKLSNTIQSKLPEILRRLCYSLACVTG